MSIRMQYIKNTYYNPQGLWHCQVLYVIRQILTRDEIMGAHLGHAETKQCTFIQENCTASIYVII